MKNSLHISGIILLLLIPFRAQSQVRTPFSGDPEKFKTELTTFLGPNLNDTQKAGLTTFLARWDSASFGEINKIKIIDIISQYHGRSMRTIPHYYNLISAFNILIDDDAGEKLLGDWLTGLSEILFNPRINNENADRYVKNTCLMVSDNILAETPSLRWKVKNSKPVFGHDTAFAAEIQNATLTCYTMRDSTEIYNVSGVYIPETMEFHGTGGRITWEKAGYPAGDVFADLEDYIINTSRNNFIIDSAWLTHKTYFKEPVRGVLSDQAISFRNKQNANFPKFETYVKEFKLDNIYEGVNYEGGMTIEGATVKGTGTSAFPARVTLFRKDTLYLNITSTEYLFDQNGLTSAETSATLYLENDSIYHSNLGFSYNAGQRLVNLYRAANPVSKSPYFNSFHNLDMYFELLSWNMNESKIMMTRPRGAALGMAAFESASFFDSNYFLRLSGIDQYHPLNRLRKFADWYYSDTFPVEELAKWMNKPLEAVTSMCIDMANKGFIFYNRAFNEITLKKKVDDFLTAFARKKDYDILYFTSETKAPVDNAILDLKDNLITVNGVQAIYLSDSQRVAIYPYDQRVVIGRNRNIQFDGVVQAGLFTIFGHEFDFDYDTFKIDLQKIDSIRLAVETDEKDANGRALIREIENLIQLGTAELFIDQPDNKSGLKSLKQYPVFNALTYSYIFYDDIPGLEGVYPKEDFYFRVDPFNYENIDHFRTEEIKLSGEFNGGTVIEPMPQYLTVQENNSLGFNMNIPEEGLEIYGSKGSMFDNLVMSNEGMTGSGTLKHLTATVRSEKFRFFPDSVVTLAESFTIDDDGTGLYPGLKAENVNIKWLTTKDELIARNTVDRNFDMFGNGTMLAGDLILSPGSLKGSGIIGTPDSRITSEQFSFTSQTIHADTSDYNLLSKTTSGYSFIAENAKTDVDFGLKKASFRLNTDSSVVKFPEVQYVCTMTDFTYNMDTRILDMEQEGKSETPLLSPGKLLEVDRNNLDRPTFLATNVIGDTISFSSWKGRYFLDEEYIEAENINYIPVADALIQPGNGKITIRRRGRIDKIENANVAVNNRHLLNSATINIISTKRYSGSGVYDYTDENKEIQKINFPEITVDSLVTTAKGYIPANPKFMLSQAFTFTGDVTLSADKEHLLFSGGAGIVHDCGRLKSYTIKFNSLIDPENVMIPVSDKPRDINDNMVFTGSFINLDSIHIYPAFLSAQKSWTDVAVVKPGGYMYYEKSKGRYLVASLEKIADQTRHGNMVALDRNMCILYGEGKLDLGTDFNLARMDAAGNITHNIDSGKVRMNAILAFDFFFDEEALNIMSNDIKLLTTLKPVNLNSELYRKGMNDLLGEATATKINEEMNLFGTSGNLPKDFNYELVLNDVNLYWNDATSSFRSEGRIGIGFIGNQPVNLYVDGYIEIQRRRSGDLFDIYLKADDSNYFYFSYLTGNLMVQAGNNNFNTLIATKRLNERRHPESTNQKPYIYMISVEERMEKFIQRMKMEDVFNENEPLR
ncbi:MAG TPA: hypothetical protein PLV06_00280 [Bacteroidales bacterium]|nr:hypothetical protein [Bacteroidales bacterium]HPJ58402.1 hypothetical protein [Bacteroidales bacterium]HPR10792.1 hypothetical protein [Bacteroidales bacterium]HRW86083.1 hypothetical protein [Bacteroidales bacterium]